MPTEELEHELRRAFAKAAAGYQHPELARQRLLQRNYRPGSGPGRLAASFTAVAAAGAVVLGRSRAIRARQSIPRMAGALAVVAAAVLAVTTLIPASRPATAQLAAWTVARQADGSIRVTIRQLRDPAGLQRTLRADGVPASVTLARQQNPACRPYSSLIQRARLLSLVVTVTWPREPVNFVIHPAALPPGAGLQITALHQHHDGFGLVYGMPGQLVQASPQCTGS